MQLSFTLVDQLERSAAGKLRAVVSEVARQVATPAVETPAAAGHAPVAPPLVLGEGAGFPTTDYQSDALS